METTSEVSLYRMIELQDGFRQKSLERFLVLDPARLLFPGSTKIIGYPSGGRAEHHNGACAVLSQLDLVFFSVEDCNPQIIA